MELTEAIDLIEQEFEHHGLFQHGWTYGFETKCERKLLGQCHPDKHVIYISATHVKDDTRASVHETILHEIAHALNIAFPEDNVNHGPHWQSIAKRLGATPAATCPTEKEQKVIYLPYIP